MTSVEHPCDRLRADECRTFDLGLFKWSADRPKAAGSEDEGLDGDPLTGGLQCGDVELVHREHRLRRAGGRLGVALEELGHAPRRDLPGQAVAVLAPAAGALG